MHRFQNKITYFPRGCNIENRRWKAALEIEGKIIQILPLVFEEELSILVTDKNLFGFEPESTLLITSTSS